MRINKKIFLFVLASIFSFAKVSAHEAYVLNDTYFWQKLHSPISLHAFDALKNPHDLKITIIVTACVLLFFSLNFIFRRTKGGRKFNAGFEKLSSLGPIFVRVAISAALFFSAYTMSFLGPELSLNSMPLTHILQWVLYVSSFMILFGIFTEVAAFAGLAVYTMGLFVFGTYIFTYLNYLGEFIVLFLFGMRKWSFDYKIFGPLKRFKNFRKYETSIIRVLYGLALIYAAVTVKFLHPELMVTVVNQWNLTQFHWLFPSDPLLITFGAGLAECAIGLFIVFGFEMRSTILISLFYITLSLIYFKEIVWPHLMLYGISLSLLVKPEIFTLDHLFFKKHRKKKKWWKRPFEPHEKH